MNDRDPFTPITEQERCVRVTWAESVLASNKYPDVDEIHARTILAYEWALIEAGHRIANLEQSFQLLKRQVEKGRADG